MISYLKPLLLSLIFLLQLAAANAQSSITFINKSHTTIDSIVLKSDRGNIIRVFNVVPGEFSTKLMFPQFSNQSPVSSGIFYIYNQGSVFRGFIPGNAIDNKDTFYVFDHGWNTRNEQIERPSNFTLYCYNSAEEKVDSIWFESTTLSHIDTLTPRSNLYYLQYPINENTPSVFFKINSKIYSSKLSHDFNNWMELKMFCWIDNDSIHTGVVPFEAMREYIFDFDCMFPLTAKSIEVEADASLLSTQNSEVAETGVAHKRIIVDRKLFKDKPTITLIYKGKKTKISFDKETLEDPKYGLLFYSVLDAKRHRRLKYQSFLY